MNPDPVRALRTALLCCLVPAFILTILAAAAVAMAWPTPEQVHEHLDSASLKFSELAHLSSR
ncbi:hypothetical protein GWK18_09915 [Kocuria sp. JC486]|uniref:hypothetical protein n=1 Tax=Kocuria sp. JC486 TaxID=1970736 RepID=UPI0014200F88|nr:hypothetical protein [Kocuria sp. JC486]NHU85894.1 hypothetical protein [Kocuria sp. JC486]